MASTFALISAGPIPAGSTLTIWTFVASIPAPLAKAGHCWNTALPALMAMVLPARSFGVLITESANNMMAHGLRRKMLPTVLMPMALETLLPTIKPSANTIWLALLAINWAVLPDPLPAVIAASSPTSR